MDGGLPPGGGDGGRGNDGNAPRKNNAVGGARAGGNPLDVFGDGNEGNTTFMAALLLFAMLVEYLRNISPCTC